MKPVHTFNVVPSLPEALEKLRDLAYNLRWSWNHETIALFRRLDSDLWEKTFHNPVLMLGMIDQARLEAAAFDEGFLAQLKRVAEDQEMYLEAKSTWYSRTFKQEEAPLIAYFSAEFGITESLSIFAGGLGVLAGDHLKSASDLGVPLIGVGILYQQGYFQQYLNEAGWQQEAYQNNDFNNLPVTLVRGEDGEPLKVTVPHPGREVVLQVWKAQVGRVPLYLLDSNLPDNDPVDRDLTDQLYGGATEMRIRQEMVLGIGGYRAIKAMKLSPKVYHMNEGHSAFLALERTRRYMEAHDFSFPEAREAALAGLVFTTHTPVAAGHDYFTPELVEKYLGNYIQKLGLNRQDFLALGRKNPQDQEESFCMTVLALRMAVYSNGVSRLHGKVSREMWQELYPGVPTDEIPISHITNGVHFPSWLSSEMKELYDRYLGLRWREDPGDREMWERLARISVEELWRTRERRRERLVAFCRRRMRSQLKRRGASQAALQAADEVLDPSVLTIGFARRFATYKRATLLLRDPDRLDRILNHPEHPVQVIYSGKAHPLDDPGKELISQIIDLAQQDRFRRRLVFIEDYDMAVARYLLQGADVWLNTPLRPREASGTSGMKATANGGLNLSVLDGWWDEAYTPEVGWAIGRRETYQDRNYQDQVEAEALYGLLEKEVVPMFYDRDEHRLPLLWIDKIKTSMQNLCLFFNTHRMVADYTEKFYLPVFNHFRRFTADGMEKATALAAWKSRIHQHWSEVEVVNILTGDVDEVQIGEKFEVQAQIQLGNLTPEDVTAELYWGPVNPHGEITKGRCATLSLDSRSKKDVYLYHTQVTAEESSGLHGYTVRVHPSHPDLETPFIPGLITWA